MRRPFLDASCPSNYSLVHIALNKNSVNSRWSIANWLRTAAAYTYSIQIMPYLRVPRHEHHAKLYCIALHCIALHRFCDHQYRAELARLFGIPPQTNHRLRFPSSLQTVDGRRIFAARRSPTSRAATPPPSGPETTTLSDHDRLSLSAKLSHSHSHSHSDSQTVVTHVHVH